MYMKCDECFKEFENKEAVNILYTNNGIVNICDDCKYPIKAMKKKLTELENKINKILEVQKI